MSCMYEEKKISLNNKFEDSAKLEKTNNIHFSHTNDIPRFCIHCGSPLEVGDVFCCECGSKIENTATADDTKKTEKGIENSNIAFITKVPSDRMASILETSKVKSGEISNDYHKPELALTRLFTKANTNKDVVKKTLDIKQLHGYYIYKGLNMTQYLSIDDVQDNSIKATVKTNFTNLSFSTEFYEGSFSDGKIILHITHSDLHPIPGGSIKLSETFTGEIGENEILGNFTGEFSNSVVFKKI